MDIEAWSKVDVVEAKLARAEAFWKAELPGAEETV